METFVKINILEERKTAIETNLYNAEIYEILAECTTEEEKVKRLQEEIDKLENVKSVTKRNK